MVVDDQIYNIFVLEQIIMEELNVENMDKAMSGPAAIQQIKERSDQGIQYDFVLLDLQMPGMSGFQCVSKLRELERNREIDLQHTKIYAVSGTSDSEFRTHREHSEFFGFLEKPISKTRIAQVLGVNI